MATGYPVGLSVDYPERKLNRLTTFFRIFVAIPILIIFGLLLDSSVQFSAKDGASSAAGLGLIVLPLVLLILFRRKYPKWWYDWNLNLASFMYRIDAYIYLLTDMYPSTDEEQSVHVELSYPDATGLNRWLPLVKWLLAIPHIIVLACLGIAVLVVTVIAWFAILFTGNYPKGMFDFVVGVMRWGFRVMAYALILVTDKYPPFSLEV
jgi:hypothetical protein